MRLTNLGVWAATDGLTAAAAAAFAKRVEAWGYGALWIPEAFGREVFSASAWLLANTSRLIVASGIANIYARDSFAAAAAQKGLNEQSGGRFLLGLGVSHIPLVQGVRKHEYGKPVATMRTYLEGKSAATYRAVAPESPPQTVLAALGPKMLELARDRTAGAHPYFTPPEHTAFARQVLGAAPLLVPEIAVALSAGPEGAAQARDYARLYLRLPNYTGNLRRFGYTDADIDGGGSDRLMADVVPHGPEASLARIAAHLEAGADHVVVQFLGAGGKFAAGDLTALADLTAVLR